FLKESGVQFALDDFGTGYSNLFYLECFTVDFIKVDKMFTQGLERCKQSHYIIETILELSKKLNIKTIAEGVENMELVNKLMLLGVDYFQGYYFGQAIELCSFIKEYRKTV
ncbi:EAL domain-containing protein, partial [Escherichia coli]